MKFNTVIIGGGHAGGTLAISLRSNKYRGSIAIIGEEIFFPYQRPPLSKNFLNSSADIDKLYLKSKEFYQRKNIDVLLSKKVKSIVKEKKYLILNNKQKIFYDVLVLATGSINNTLNVKGINSTFHYLRNIEDALKFKKSINNIRNLTIVGAGYIGLEVAASLKSKNLKITIIDMDERVMSRSIDSNLSDFFYRKHISQGVHFLFNQSIEGIKNKKGINLLELKNQITLESEVILIAIGVKPNIDLAQELDLDCDNGIKINKFGETSEKDIYATGDCVNHYNPILKTQLRLESVQNAVELSNIIALKICGISKPYINVPWFWSDQYNIKLQIAGSSTGHDKSFIRGDPEKEKFSIFYQKNNQLVSVHCINSPKDFMLGKKLILHQKEFQLNLLEDPKIKFQDII